MSQDKTHTPTEPFPQSRVVHDEGQPVPSGAAQARSQEQEAVAQMAGQAQLAINEGGRTNDSSATENPEGAVHGLPKPALKGTWR
jgi:hypothetical protein